MDEPLITADPREVMRRMAEELLAAPFIAARQGEIELAPHQVDAASRLLDLLGSRGGAVLADATGLGKTFVAIAVARLIGPATVVAPAALRNMWLESLRRCGVHASVESYESFSRGKRASKQPALLVLDEAHHARNPKTRRYAALAELAWGAKVLLLTATPIHNRQTDLRALLALFLGSPAFEMSEEAWRPLIVRRSALSLKQATGLPVVARPRWLSVPCDATTLRLIRTLPEAVPASDGSQAHALLQLGLIRAWCSSDAALRGMLKRRLQRSASLSAALEAGRLPDRRELAASLIVDDAIQLGFPGLFGDGTATIDVEHLKDALVRHVDGVRAIIAALETSVADRERVRLLQDVRAGNARTPVVAFTQFADTADLFFRASIQRGGAALVTGRGARIASGSIPVEEIIRGFDAPRMRDSGAMPLDLLIATDVLSEGLSLRRAGVLVHLDLPWTIARLEQRVGRLRRIGSTHGRIDVCAIGPPVESRQLLTMVRALQRKARLGSGVTGVEEAEASLPLLGRRLTQATARITGRDDANAMEELRRELKRWLKQEPVVRAPIVGAGGSPVALGLVRSGNHHRLLAVEDSRVSGRTADVLRVVRIVSTGSVATEAEANGATAAIGQWLEAERADALASGAHSAIHLTVLRILNEVLARASRAERACLAARVERCRKLVMATQGLGAELALAQLVDAENWVDLNALEQLLASRNVHENPSSRGGELVSMIAARQPA